MKKEVRDLTEGSLARGIFVFGVPLMLSNVLQVLFNMSDVAVVGRFAGSAALGSVGSTTTLVTLFTGILIGIGCGVNALTARCCGARDHRGVTRTASSALVVCLVSGVVLSVFGILAAPKLLALLHTKDDLIDGALLYFRIYMVGMPARALYNYGNGIFSAFGETRKPLAYLFVSGVVNVILNLIFVIGFGLAEAGVALASAISQVLSALLILTDLFANRKKYGFEISVREISRKGIASVLELGIPSGLQNAIFQIANLFIQGAVNSFDTVVVEGNAAAANADALVYDVMAAFYTACSSFIAQNYGAGKRDRVRKTYRISLFYSFAVAAVMGVGLYVFHDAFLSLFTSDPAVVAQGTYRLKIMSFSYCVSAFMDCTIAASRGLGKSVVPTVIVVCGSCVFRVIWIYTVFAAIGTISSIYLLYIFSWTITAIAEILYFRRVYRSAFRDIPNENPEPSR